ncbi:MAG: methyltransferase [Candidatus Buchananbacteria bacterium]
MKEQKEISFFEYFGVAKKYIGNITLVFEFLKNQEGIGYNIFKKGKLIRYLSSHYLVRDRKKLKNNKTWLCYKKDFNKKIVVGYQGLWFFCRETVWSPSVDAVFMIDAINKYKSLSINNFSSILDYGCGSGVVGISLAKKSKKVKELSLVDVNDSALFCSLINCIGNNLKVNFNIANHLNKKRYDLGLVTPYYFPIEKRDYLDSRQAMQAIVKAGKDSAIMINDLSKICSEVFFVYSSITEKVFREELSVKYKDVCYMDVPFSLGDNVSSNSLVGAAAENNLLIFKKDSQFKFWHRIYMAKIIS